MLVLCLNTYGTLSPTDRLLCHQPLHLSLTSQFDRSEKFPRCSLDLTHLFLPSALLIPGLSPFRADFSSGAFSPHSALWNKHHVHQSPWILITLVWLWKPTWQLPMNWVSPEDSVGSQLAPNAVQGSCGCSGSGGLFGVSVPTAPGNFISAKSLWSLADVCLAWRCLGTEGGELRGGVWG